MKKIKIDLMDTALKYHVILWTVLLFLGIAITWAYHAEVAQTTVGFGRVIPSQKVKVIQNLEGGIIKSILVKEGDTVKKGQTLMYIDDTEFTSHLDESESKKTALTLQIARLKAELSHKAFTINPITANKNPSLAESELALYRSRLAKYHHQKDILQQQMNQRTQQLIEHKAKQEKLKISIDIIEKELAMISDLVPKGLVSKVRLYRIQRELNDKQAELDNNIQTLPRLQSSIKEGEKKIAELDASFETEISKELNESQEQLARLLAAETALADRVTRAMVKSPVSGTIKKLHINTIGGVIKPGMNLVEIVPLDDTLLIEAQIKPADIAFLRPGLKTNIKITAYDYSIYGSLAGDIEHISADTMLDDKGNSYYLINLRTQKNYLEKDNQQLPIIPGMLTQVDIITGKKTVLSYILKPILKAKDNALRER